MLVRASTWWILFAIASSGVGACSSSSNGGGSANKPWEGSNGALSLTLQPVAGVTVNTVHYVVTQASSTSPALEGDLPTQGGASTFSFGLPLPVGSGYSLSLSGAAVESKTTTCVGSSGPFAISANANTALELVLTCTDAANGSVNDGVTVQTDACPHLIVDYVVASPSTANAPNGLIALSGAAHDLDGKSLSFAWTISDPTAGAFAPANSAASSFTCQAAGTNLVATLTASNGQCSKPLSTTISCTNVTCGNGKLDPGEQCDPTIPAGQAGFGPCPANCHFSCGNGIVEAPAEQCDPPNPNLGCSPSCQTTVECGDGFLEPGEECDGTLFPPGTLPGAVCNSSCRIVVVVDQVFCGDGRVSGAEVCDQPFTVNDCGRDCMPITRQSCVACEMANDNCPNTSCDSVPGNAGAGPAAGTPRSNLCNEVLDCVRKSGCAAGGQLPIRCYCGTATPTQCAAGQGNGACKTQLERGLESTDFNTIASRLGNTAFGGGKAMDRINCDQTFCDNTADGSPSSAVNRSECF